MMDYATTINLENTGKNQLILASQEMGSFYCVFARFTKLKDDNYSIFFESITYKGNIRISVKKVSIHEEKEGDYHHIKILTGIEIGDIEDIKIPTIKLKKGQKLIFERHSLSEKDLPKYLVSEENFIQSKKWNVGNRKTPYSLESELSQDYLGKIKRGDKAASGGGFCVVGLCNVI